MLKKWPILMMMMLAMAGMSAAATMTPVTPSKDGNCYQIGTAAELYGFAAIVNGTDGHTAEPAACGVLTADIVVNEHVLKNASGESCVNDDGSYTCSAPTNTWTPIGVYYTGNIHPFQGTFDGLGHTISGLFDGRGPSYTGLFGYVSGTNATVSIKNVGVEDSYFSVKSYAGGIVGMVSNGSGELNIENVYSASAFYINGEGYVGGLLGRVGSGWTLNITNAYNSGSIFGTGKNSVAGLVGYISSSAAVSIKNAFNYGNLNGYAPLVNSKATVTNSFYLGDAAQGSYGVNKSASDFSNGAVLALLQQGENGSVWQSGSPYPTLLIKSHSATLHYSSTESETIYFVEGSTASLPTVDKSGNPVLGWYDNEGLTGTKYTEIPASANSDLTLYPKVMKLVGGCYEISDADMLYAFAAAVNNGNTTACGKLTANIVVNQNVLTTADGTSNVSSSGEYIGSNSASFRQWTPIGVYNTKPFTGTFDGQGHTISGLFDNNTSSAAKYTGLFGYVSGTNATISIKNVGVEDSYFRVDSYAGGIVGMVYNGSGTLNIENVYSASTFNVIGSGSVLVGGLVGYVGPDWTLNITNAYNLGSIFAEQNIFYCAGLVGYIYSSEDRSAKAVNIKNAFNYGTLSGGCFALLNAPGESVDVSVENSYYLGNQTQGAYGEFKSKDDFDNGMVFAALYSYEDGEVWHQYAGDDYPTFVEKTGTPMHVAVLHYSETDSVVIAYTEGTALTLPATLPDGSIVVGDWYKSNSLSGDTYTQIAATENGDLNFYAKAMKLDSDGYYEIADADMLFKFAELVNTQNSTYGSAKAKLTADIVVNEHVLAIASGESNVNATTGEYIGTTTGLREWTPIGFGKVNENIVSFNGLFDGQGHSISGLYFNKADAQYVGLFGTLSTATIKNVGVEDSYFKGFDCIGGILGFVDIDASVNIENVYNAAVVVGGDRAGGIIGGDFGNKSHVTNAYNVGLVLSYVVSAGGIVGYNYSAEPTTIQNSFNYGTVSAGSGTAGALIGMVDDDDDAAGFSVTNSYYLGDAVQGDYGTVKSVTEFANGTVYAALHSGENGEVWRQYDGDDYPTLVEKSGASMHVAVLHYSETDSVVIAYTEGTAFTLPTEDKSGNPITGWTTSADGTGDAITEIPTSATTDLKLYPKAKTFEPNAEGFYEIATADDLYKFAEIVNGGNATAKAKLMNDIVVNENVLATAGGISNVDGTTGDYIGADSASFRKWTPIGYCTVAWKCPAKFQGSFDGQGHTISGLYYNDENSYETGLFGYIGGTSSEVSILNVGIEDSYFKAGQFAGGILGRADENTDVKVENVSNASVAVAATAGGIVGRIYGKYFDMTNAYNVGSIFGTSAGGLVGNIYSDNSAVINNSYSYGPFKDGAGALIGSVSGGPSPTVTNSYYLADEVSGSYGSNASASDFENGTVLAALRSGEGGYVWVQAEGDKYPTIDINASKNANTIVLDWTNAADSTTLVAAGYTAGAMVIVKSGKQFYAGGAIYEGILSADQVKAIGGNKLYPISGVELATDNGVTTATLDGSDGARQSVMIPTNVEVDRVIYKRNITAGAYTTVMLPFDVDVVNNTSVKDKYTFYKFCGVDSDNLGTIINVAPVTTKFKANRPYIMIAEQGGSNITFEQTSVKYILNTTTSSTDATVGDYWTMHGVYEYKVWPEGDRDLGYVYGFANKAGLDNQIGEFVKVGSGADIVPMRMYLKETKPQSVRGNGKYNYSSHTGPAKVVRVQIVEGDGDDETTAIKHVATVPTVVKSNRWFDVKGRALNGKPTAKGTYYYNGQRVIIK